MRSHKKLLKVIVIVKYNAYENLKFNKSFKIQKLIVIHIKSQMRTYVYKIKIKLYVVLNKFINYL